MVPEDPPKVITHAPTADINIFETCEISSFNEATLPLLLVRIVRRLLLVVLAATGELLTIQRYSREASSGLLTLAKYGTAAKVISRSGTLAIESTIL